MVEAAKPRLDAGIAAELLADPGLWRDFNDICDCGGRLAGTESEKRAFALLRPINHADTAAALGAERAFLAVLEGSCRTPIAGHAAVAGGRLAFRGLIAKPDGSEVLETQRHGAVTDAARLGAEAARELKLRAGADFFAAV